MKQNVSGCFFSEHSVYCVGGDVKPCSINQSTCQEPLNGCT